MGRLTRFLPLLAWMVVIAVLSGERFGADRTSAWVLPLLGASPWDRSAQGPNGRDDR